MLIKLQKQASRLILDADHYAPSAPLFRELNWPTFDKIVDFKHALLVYKSLNNLAPSYMTNVFQTSGSNSTCTLRSETNRQLCIPRAHHKSLRFCGPKVWNSLNDQVRKAKTVKQFKTQCQLLFQLL